MTQSAFAHALFDPEAALPAGVCGPDGQPDLKRFQVYRNNVAASLTRALEAAFPVVRQLVGAEFFTGMALAFQRRHPPRHRQMMLYGGDFPSFLETFPPVAHLGYLPDVARLEQAIRESYHAADSTPLPADHLACLTETDLLSARISLAPSLRLLSSDWPVLAIWQAHGGTGPAPVMEAQDVAVFRPLFDPVPMRLPQGGLAFLARLRGEEPLQQALSQAPADFDLASVLGLLLQNNAITGLKL